MSYPDLLVIIDPGSARTAQAVIWKRRGKKKPTQNLKRFSAVFEKDADNEVFFPLPGEGWYFNYLIWGKEASAWKSSSQRGLLYKQGCFLQWFLRANFPPRRLMANELRALTSAVRAELAKLNPLLSLPNCLDLGANREKRLFCFKAFPKRVMTDRKWGLRVKEGMRECGINTRNLGGEFCSGNVSVHIFRSIWSFPNLFSAFPFCYIRKKLKLRATAHLQQIWRGQVTEKWGHREEDSGEKGSLQKRQDTRNSCQLLTFKFNGFCGFLSCFSCFFSPSRTA